MSILVDVRDNLFFTPSPLMQKVGRDGEGAGLDKSQGWVFLPFDLFTLREISRDHSQAVVQITLSIPLFIGEPVVGSSGDESQALGNVQAVIGLLGVSGDVSQGVFEPSFPPTLNGVGADVSQGAFEVWQLADAMGRSQDESQGMAWPVASAVLGGEGVDESQAVAGVGSAIVDVPMVGRSQDESQGYFEITVGFNLEGRSQDESQGRGLVSTYNLFEGVGQDESQGRVMTVVAVAGLLGVGVDTSQGYAELVQSLELAGASADVSQGRGQITLPSLLIGIGSDRSQGSGGPLLGQIGRSQDESQGICSPIALLASITVVESGRTLSSSSFTISTVGLDLQVGDLLVVWAVRLDMFPLSPDIPVSPGLTGMALGTSSVTPSALFYLGRALYKFIGAGDLGGQSYTFPVGFIGAAAWWVLRTGLPYSLKIGGYSPWRAYGGSAANVTFSTVSSNLSRRRILTLASLVTDIWVSSEPLFGPGDLFSRFAGSFYVSMRSNLSSGFPFYFGTGGYGGPWAGALEVYI